MDLSTSRLSYLVVAIAIAVTALPGPGLRAEAAVRRPEVGCRSCIVVADDGTVLWSRAADERVAIASTTKMLTALVVIGRADPGAEVTVSAAAAATPQGKLSLEAGETFSVEELLYGLLLNSSNDAAVALAEHVSTSEQAFVVEMNRHAAALGAGDTQVTTSHGLDQPGHYSTALDLVTITRALLADPLLARIVATPQHTIEGSDRSVSLENTNVLLETYPGTIGVKTGFTAEAGNVLVAAARRRGRTLISVALGSVDHFADSVALLDYGFERLANELLLARGSDLGFLFTDSGGGVAVTTRKQVRGTRPPGGIDVAFVASADLTASVTQGQVVGTAVVRSAYGVVGRTVAVAGGSLHTEEESWVSRALAGILRSVGSILPGEG